MCMYEKTPFGKTKIPLDIVYYAYYIKSSSSLFAKTNNEP